MRSSVLLLAIAGCCPAIDAEEPIYFDEQFTELELMTLTSVIGEWATAMDRDLPPLHYGEPHGWSLESWVGDRSIVHRMVEDEALVIRQFWSPKFVGLASSEGSIALAIERIGTLDRLAKVYRHEQGHRLGCLQHSDPPSLMVGTLGKDLPCIDAETIEEVCDQQPSGCGPNAGSTCTAEDYQ